MKMKCRSLPSNQSTVSSIHSSCSMFLKLFTAMTIIVMLQQTVMTTVTGLQTSSSSSSSSSSLPPSPRPSFHRQDNDRGHPFVTSSSSALSSSSSSSSSSSPRTFSSSLSPPSPPPLPSSSSTRQSNLISISRSRQQRRRHDHGAEQSNQQRPFISSALSSYLSANTSDERSRRGTGTSSRGVGSRSRRPVVISTAVGEKNGGASQVDNKDTGKSYAADRQRLYNLSQQRHQHPLLSLNLNLDSLAELGAADRAQQFLQRINALHGEGYYEVSPDVVSYNSVLKAWKEHDDPIKAMEFLDKMILSSATSASSLPSESQATGAAGAAAAATTTTTTKIFDVISCNTVMAAFAQRGLYNETLDLLRKMQQSQEQEKRPTDSDKNGSTTNQYAYPAPDTISYNSCLYALARSSSSSSFSSSRSSYKHKSKQSSNYGDERRQNHLTATAAAIEAEKVLNNMSNDPNVDPDTLSYNTVLYAWSNAASDTEEGGDHNEMVVSALKAAQRADELLTTMEELADRQSEKRSTVTNKTNRKSNRIQKQSTDIEPDQYSYTTVMQAYAKAQRPDRARDVLERMIQRGVQPNRHVCTALMSAWSKSGQVEEAQRMLYQLMDDYEVAGHSEYKPDTAAFSSVIDGWAKVSNADRPEAATYAVELLEQMKEWADIKYGDDTFRPNAQTYTSVMTALAKSCAWDACEKVRAILEDLEDEYNQSTSILTAKNGQGSHTNDGLVDDKYSTVVRPTNIHYNALLLAFARSPHENKAHLAYNTFKMMQQHQRPDCRPDTISYNTLLLACANTSDKEMKQEALKIAVEAFRSIVQETKRKEDDDINSKRGNHSQFRSSIQATSTTFNHFLKTSRLSISSKDQLASVVSKTIQICCEMGMMNHLIVHQAQLACKTKKEWEDIAGELHVYVPWKADFKNSCSNVPAKWKKNARR